MTPPAKGVEPDDGVADVQLAARPVAFVKSLDTADPDVGTQPADVPAGE